MSRRNDPTIDVHPAPSGSSAGSIRCATETDGESPHSTRTTNRIAAERLSDGARAVFRWRLPQRARDAGLRDDRAFGPGRYGRQLLRHPRRGLVAGDGLRCDDPRPSQQRSRSCTSGSPTKPTTTTRNRRMAKGSTSRAAATNTQPPNTSGRFSPTTTGLAPCTPKLNAPKATYFRTWSPNSFYATGDAVARGESPGVPTSELPSYGATDTSEWRPPNEHPQPISMPMDSHCDPTFTYAVSSSTQNSSQSCDSTELRVVVAAVGTMARPPSSPENIRAVADY